MKIKTLDLDTRKKIILITTAKGEYSLPFVKLPLSSTLKNKITDIFIDKELGKEAITYFLESGEEESVHLDVFLDFNREPDFLRKLFLFKLTHKAQEELISSKLSKNKICRKLQTSPSQLARLLDQTNHKKSVDKMLELLAVLGITVKPDFEMAKSG